LRLSGKKRDKGAETEEKIHAPPGLAVCKGTFSLAIICYNDDNNINNQELEKTE